MGGAISCANISLTNSNFINNNIFINTNIESKGGYSNYIRLNGITCYGGAIESSESVSSINSQFINNSINAHVNNPSDDKIDDWNPAKSYYIGGAVYVTDDFTSLNSNFTKNSIYDDAPMTYNIYHEGGAIYVENDIDCKGTDFINNTLISYSTSASGIAIYSYVPSGEIKNCKFINNNFTNLDYSSSYHMEQVSGVVYLYMDIYEFTISDSIFEDNCVECGAIYIDGEYSEATVFIANCNFTRNHAMDTGGAIYTLDDADVSVNNSRFINNSANGSAGAIYTEGSMFIFESYFENNQAFCEGEGNCGFGEHGFGGAGAIGVNGNDGEFRISDSLFINNTAYQGGAILIHGCDHQTHIINSSFINNAAVEGGAIYYRTTDTSGYLTDVVFINNTAEIGGALCTYDESGIIADKCIFINNSAVESGGASYLECAYCDNNFTSCTFINNSASKGGALNFNRVRDCILVKYCIFDDNHASEGRDIHIVERSFDDIDFDKLSYNYWSMNFTSIEEFITSDIIHFTDWIQESINFSVAPANWVLMSIYGNDPLKVFYNESFIVTFDRVCTNESVISSFDGVLPDYWTSVYVYEGRLLTSNGLLGASVNSLLGAEADYNHEWDNENVGVGDFIANIWLRNNTGSFYFTPDKAIPYTFRTHSPFTIWEEAVFTTSAEWPVADLVINKSVTPGVVVDGENVLWTLTVVNDGPDMAIDAYVEDVLPAGLTFFTSSASKGFYNSSTGVWTIGNLTNGETVTLNIVTIAKDLKSITNIAFVNSSSNDPDLTNNYANATVNVTLVADLEISKIVSLKSVKVGDTVTWAITVTNKGPSTAVNTIVNDILPDSLTYISSSASKGDYDSVNGIWSVGNLTSGETVTLIITTVVGDVEGIVNNHVNVSSDTNDSDLSNNEADENITVTKDTEEPDEPDVPDVPEEPKPVQPDKPTKVDEPKVLKKLAIKKVGNPILVLIICLVSLVLMPRRNRK